MAGEGAAGHGRQFGGGQCTQAQCRLASESGDLPEARGQRDLRSDTWVSRGSHTGPRLSAGVIVWLAAWQGWHQVGWLRSLGPAELTGAPRVSSGQ